MTHLQANYLPPQSPLEEALAEAWVAAFAVDRVSRDDSFFALGGDSIMAAQMIGRVQEVYGVTIDLERLFEDFTLTRIAQLIEEDLIKQISALSEEEVGCFLESAEISLEKTCQN